MTFALSLAPLANAPPFIQIHALGAFLALGLGITQFARTKGTLSHRVIGWIWVLLLFSVALSSFWIHTIRQFAGFSLIHLLSVLTLTGLPLAVLAARKGRITAHEKIMKSIFIYGLIVAGLFTLLPGRILGQVLFGG